MAPAASSASAAIGAREQECVICKEELIVESSERASVRLICGHYFHLDCIGSEFNCRGGIMKCPICRRIENGNWRYAAGNPPTSPPRNEDDHHDQPRYLDPLNAHIDHRELHYLDPLNARMDHHESHYLDPHARMDHHELHYLDSLNAHTTGQQLHDHFFNGWPLPQNVGVERSDILNSSEILVEATFSPPPAFLNSSSTLLARNVQRIVNRRRRVDPSITFYNEARTRFRASQAHNSGGSNTSTQMEPSGFDSWL